MKKENKVTTEVVSAEVLARKINAAKKTKKSA